MRGVIHAGDVESPQADMERSSTVTAVAEGDKGKVYLVAISQNVQPLRWVIFRSVGELMDAGQ